ncbi:Guanylate-kinase-associated protein (GKAP) protein [Microdochium nivale]|nr:Guanylate-kinase-associated protein (GKAP) protein [Microdochium nivale]
MTSSTSHDRTSRTTTTLSRVLGSSPASVEIKGGTESQERNTGGFNQKEQAGTHTHHHGRDEMRPASKRTPNAMATTASTTAKSRDNNNSNQDLESSSSSPLPESPDFDIEAQMKSGRPVLLTRNREQALSAGGAGFLRLVDAAQGRREGWLAPAGQVLADFNDVGGHDGREPTAAGAGARGDGTATTRNSAMVLDPQQSSTLRDVAGHAGASSKGDWIWDGMWHNPNG